MEAMTVVALDVSTFLRVWFVAAVPRKVNDASIASSVSSRSQPSVLTLISASSPSAKRPNEARSIRAIGARDKQLGELESAFLAVNLEIALKPRPDHAGYIESWLERLMSDKGAIVQAAGYAQKAVD